MGAIVDVNLGCKVLPSAAALTNASAPRSERQRFISANNANRSHPVANASDRAARMVAVGVRSHGYIAADRRGLFFCCSGITGDVGQRLLAAHTAIDPRTSGVGADLRRLLDLSAVADPSGAAAADGA